MSFRGNILSLYDPIQMISNRNHVILSYFEWGQRKKIETAKFMVYFTKHVGHNCGMRLRLCTICRKSENGNFLIIKYLFLILKRNKLIIAYIIIYRDAIGRILPISVAKCLSLLK